jgi:hypothetical protein
MDGGTIEVASIDKDRASQEYVQMRSCARAYRAKRISFSVGAVTQRTAAA